MFCFRHGEVDHVSTHNNAAAGSAIHFLSCGCFGTSEQLRDENYNPNPPSGPDPRIAELEARVAELEAERNAAPPVVVATPAAVAHADETGVDLTQVAGSGAEGTITKADVIAAAPSAADAAPAVPESEPAGAEAGAPTAADTPAAPSDADSTKADA